MKAKKKPIKEIALDSIEVNLDKKVDILKTKAPEARKGGIKVESVDELIDKLRNEAKVIWMWIVFIIIYHIHSLC